MLLSPALTIPSPALCIPLPFLFTPMPVRRFPNKLVPNHGCTKLPNLEMEPKCLTKSDVQLIPDISRTQNDKRIL